MQTVMMVAMVVLLLMMNTYKYCVPWKTMQLYLSAYNTEHAVRPRLNNSKLQDLPGRTHLIQGDGSISGGRS